MTEEEKYGNKLIGEAIGWKLICLMPEDGHYEFQKFDDKGEVIDMHCGGDSWSWNEGDTLPFHSSWEWIMEAVKRLPKIMEEKKIDDGTVNIQIFWHAISSPLTYVEKERVFKILVKTVEWINKSDYVKNKFIPGLILIK